MLGSNKTLFPLLFSAVIIYAISTVSRWFSLTMLFIPAMYLYMSTNKIGKVSLFVIDSERFRSWSGGILNKYVTMTRALYDSYFRDTIFLHEEAHNNCWHTLKKIVLLFVYGVVFTVAIYIQNKYVFALSVAMVIIVDYSFTVWFEVQADKATLKLGNLMQFYLKNHCSKSLCNRIRIWALGG